MTPPEADGSPDLTSAIELGRNGEVVRLLDGGLATELERAGHVLEDALWSARLLIENPAAIEAVHRAYVEAGSEVLTTATYQATFEGFANAGLSRADTEVLLRRSVELASRAGRSANRPIRIAASIGPYGAFLADGAEFRGDYSLSREELVRFHEQRFGVLAETGADLIACETIPRADEVLALADLFEAHPRISGWISFSCLDGKVGGNEGQLASGEPIEALLRRLDSIENIVAIGANCCRPAVLARVLPTLRRGTNKPLVAYPNRGETWDFATRGWRSSSEPADFVSALLANLPAGPAWVGGCCRTTPADIHRLAQKISGREDLLGI